MEEVVFKKEWLDGEILTSFEEDLYRFTRKEHRAPTIQEMSWLRMVNDCRELAAVSWHVPAAAAAAGSLNDEIRMGAMSTRRYDFRSEDGSRCVSVEVKAVPDRAPVVTVRMQDQDGRPVPHGRVLFPGTDFVLETNDYGFGSVPFAQYKEYIQTVMRLQCLASGGETMNLPML